MKSLVEIRIRYVQPFASILHMHECYDNHECSQTYNTKVIVKVFKSTVLHFYLIELFINAYVHICVYVSGHIHGS